MPTVRNVYAGSLKKGNSKRNTLAAQTQHGARDAPVYYDRHMRTYRTPDIVTCGAWLSSGKWIDLYCNPSDRGWSLPRRGTITKTAAGHVQNTWRNRYRNGSLYDEFDIQMTFQTGNIMPYMGHAEANRNTPEALEALWANPEVPPGLMNFYDFLELLNQPQLMGSYENNEHIIIMHGRVFPRIRLEGHFKIDTPLTFQESADNANQLQWQSTFHVYRTYPRIDKASQLQMVYRDWVSSEANDEVFGESAAAASALGRDQTMSQRNKVNTVGTAPGGPFSGNIDGL